MSIACLTAVPAYATYEVRPPAVTAPAVGEYGNVGYQPDYFAQFDRKLDSLAGPVGPWTSRGWDRPSGWAIDAARDAVSALRDLHLIPDTVMATAKGGIGIRFTRGTRYGSIEFLNGGEVVQLKMGIGEPDAAPVEASSKGTRDALVDLRLFLNNA